MTTTIELKLAALQKQTIALDAQHESNLAVLAANYSADKDKIAAQVAELTAALNAASTTAETSAT